MNTKIIFDFNNRAKKNDWIVVDDVVMGGESSGTFNISEDGYGVFKGQVSLENNGGFSSIRHRFPKIRVNDYSRIILKIQGDGKDYEFRVKANSKDYHSYIRSFSSSGEWEEIEIYLKDLYPSFRGRKLNRPNFSHDFIEEISILIANKRNEDFELLIDKIELK